MYMYVYIVTSYINHWLLINKVSKLHCHNYWNARF